MVKAVIKMSSEFTLDLERLENYKFKVKFDKESMGEMITDETRGVGGDGEGPNPSRLLAAATANCLMASLIFCLKKKKVELNDLKGEVTATVERVDKRLRITGLDVNIHPDIDEDDKDKLEKCLDIFEDYCVVTQSIRNGIDVNVDVEV